MELLISDGRNTEKGTGGVNPDERPKLTPPWLYVPVDAAGCGGRRAGVGSSFTRDEPFDEPGFEVEYGETEGGRAPVESSGGGVHSSSLSQMLALSSKLMITELLDPPSTRQNLSLQGSTDKTDPVLIRLKNEVDGPCDSEDGPAWPTADG